MPIFRCYRNGNMGKPINKVKLEKSDPPRIELTKDGVIRKLIKW